MNCENYLKLLEDLIEGELDEKTTDNVSLHIFDCPDCTAHFELLEREKEVYSHYLFDIEPPSDLSARFLAKLNETETQPKATANRNLFTEIFAFLRLNPIMTASAIIALFALGFVLINRQKETSQPIQAKDVTPIKPAQFVAGEKVVAVATPLPKITAKFVETATPKVEKIVQKQVEKIAPEVVPQPIVLKKPEAVKKIAPSPKATPQVNNEQLAQFKELRAFEMETEKQMEKVELLLRSFRNAQPSEENGMFDIAYEREQAHRLLPNNVALRQKAEFYGTFFAEEMLNKVEPVLLDIANLDEKPSPEQVLEIKNRVRNQNIIASLQAF